MYDKNTRMKTDDEIAMTMNFPLAEEEWDIIMDCDLENTASITFHTKHGKNVEFVKRKTGKWIEKEICETRRKEEMQVAKCSNCGKYLTTPYIYSFNHYSFCPNCGAKMEGDT